MTNQAHNNELSAIHNQKFEQKTQYSILPRRPTQK